MIKLLLTIDFFLKKSINLRVTMSTSFISAQEIPLRLITLVEELIEQPVHARNAPYKILPLGGNFDLNMVYGILMMNLPETIGGSTWKAAAFLFGLDGTNKYYDANGSVIKYGLKLDTNETTEIPPIKLLKENIMAVFNRTIAGWEPAKQDDYSLTAKNENPEEFSLFIKNKDLAITYERHWIWFVSSAFAELSNNIICSNVWLKEKGSQEFQYDSHTYIWIKKTSLPAAIRILGLQISF